MLLQDIIAPSIIIVPCLKKHSVIIVPYSEKCMVITNIDDNTMVFFSLEDGVVGIIIHILLKETSKNTTVLP